MNTAPLSAPAYTTLASFQSLEQLNPLTWLRKTSSFDLAMDLGTANILIYARRRGILLNQPSVVALDERSRKVVAVGHEAKAIHGKTGQAISTFRPLRDGVIADFEMASLMIQKMLGSVCRRFKLIKPRIVIGVPSGITQVEKRAVIDAALWSGVREVHLMEESMAAALGAGIPVYSSESNMIVDIGGGTTEVALINMGHIHRSWSLRCAGDEMDRAIQRYISRNFGVNISEGEAERAKLALGSATPSKRQRSQCLTGKDASSGLPTRLEVCDSDIRLALQEPVNAIVGAVFKVLEDTKPEVARDVLTNGIHLTGGGALLKGLDQLLQSETGIRCKKVKDPLACVARGVGQVVEDLKRSKALCLS